ncbi:MAG: 1,5-anhydro-D-fructose reductase [Candidatus Latescibacteria bacterium ADurb.Bin168]|nr:MAG: 1,5-anhydro-D-fructose reductase [Candidatus Latescibacteria bacterium ADurb.Bin168]
MAVIGMVGVGGYGATILRAAHEAKNVKLTVVHDVSPERAREAAEKTGARVATSYEEMLRDDALQGVILVVPNPLHRKMLEAAVDAGKHVYVEKPIANSVKDGMAMRRYAAAAGRILMVGHNTRRGQTFRTVKQMIDSGELGTVVAMEANFSHAGGLGVPPDAWRYRRETCPAVPLMQLGVHCVDTMNYFAGAPARVSSFMSSKIMKQNDDVTVTLVEYENGVLATLHSHYVVAGTNFVAAYGSEANVYAEWERLDITMREPYGVVPRPFPRNDTQLEEISEFAACIETGVQPETDATAGILALAVVEAAIISHKEKRIVSMEEIMKDA